jgi:hypothetical protein
MVVQLSPSFPLILVEPIVFKPPLVIQAYLRFTSHTKPTMELKIIQEVLNSQQWQRQLQSTTTLALFILPLVALLLLCRS